MSRVQRMLRCPEHPYASLIEDHHAGDLICSDCGLVVGDRLIDVGAEWREFLNDSSSAERSRVGGSENPMIASNGLYTMVGINPPNCASDEMGRSKYHNRNQLSCADRTLLNAAKEISNMADKLNLPRVIVDRASRVFRQIYESHSMRGRNIHGMASACLFFSCRQEGVSRTFKEICAVSHAIKREISKFFKFILRFSKSPKEVVSTNSFIARFCSNLGLSTRIELVTNDVIDNIRSLNICPGRSPISVVGASIFFVCKAAKQPIPFGEVASVVGISETTMRVVFKTLRKHAQELLPEAFKLSEPLEELLKL